MERRFRIQSFLIGIVIALFLAACTHEITPAETADDVASQYLRDSGVPGIAITVARNGATIWSQGFGFADVEQRVPVNPALTKFRVGSTAKSMTAMAVGRLYETGKLDLDAPIQQYLPDYPQQEGVITARLLGGHLAGIRHYKDESEMLSNVPYSSVYEALSIFKDDPLVGQPGSRFSYSSYGFNLLSAVVEAAAGEDFLSYMSTTVFDPIGMTGTVPDRVFPIVSDRSRYYEIVDGHLENSSWVDNSNKWAGGGFLSTSEDLVRFAQSHLTDHFLQADTIKMLWTEQQTSSGEKTGYGIGWSVGADAKGRRLIHHNGGSVGGTTNMRIYPDQGLVIAVITNTATGATITPLTDSLVDVFLGE